jgi:hypothetical protein
MKKKCTETAACGAVGDGRGQDAPDCAAEKLPDDAVFRDIVKKATEGNIKYQELYLKYIDLISAKTADEDEVIYEATFVDEKEKDS